MRRSGWCDNGCEKSANTSALYDLLLTSQWMTSSVGWLSVFQTVWAGSSEGCSCSIRPQNTWKETEKNGNSTHTNLMQRSASTGIFGGFCDHCWRHLVGNWQSACLKQRLKKKVRKNVSITCCVCLVTATLIDCLISGSPTGAIESASP